MKATRSKNKAFVPVELTLETQEEVDAIYALLNCNRLVCAVHVGSAYLALRPYVSKAWNRLYNMLYEELK